MSTKEPSLYQWTYDFNNWSDSKYVSSTFSIGIYQWVPKANGKGIKRTPAACRVQGYVFHKDKIYGKGKEICERLNKSNASYYRRPVWLQKLYSFTEKTWLVKEELDQLRVRDDLPGSVVRAIRRKVLKERLEGNGFIQVSGGLYVRHVGNQIHAMDYQPSTWGHKYFINQQ